MNIQLAIAAMEQNNGQSATELLRDTYPELRFLFDQLDAANEVVEDTVPADDYADLERDYATLEEDLVEAQQLVQQMRDMANVLASMKRPTAAD